MYLKDITTIFFDLDGTLRYSTPRWVDFCAEVAVMLGAPDSAENRRRAERWSLEYFSTQSELDARSYKGDWEAFWHAYYTRYARALGCGAEQAAQIAPQLYQIVEESYKREDCVPDDVYDTLEALRSAGYRIGIITNRVGPLKQYLTELGLETYLDFYFAAGEVGYSKPHPAIFRHALAVAKAAPAQSLFVGDNWYADILGALKIGMAAVLVDPHRLFPEAACPSIQSIGELQQLLLPRV